MKVSEYYQNLKLFLRNYFGFTLREANGFVILSLLIVVLLFLPLFVSELLFEKKESSVSIEILEKAETLKKTIEAQKKVEKEITFFEFDPNTASVSEFEKLGFKPKLALRIEKYRKKGGKFRIKNDLLSVYGMDSVHFERLKPYILLPEIKEKKEFAKSETKPFKEYTKTKFEVKINSADSSELVKLNGIGPAFASRIIKYRNKLGGFVSLNQLTEVYGLDSSKLIPILGQITIDDNIKKLNVNTSSSEELASHPYIKRHLAKLIYEYRYQHGKYETIDDLLKIRLITKESLEKMKPYLEL